MDIAHPVRAEVDSVSFSFYTEDDIKNLAVKEITNPDPFDNLDHPNNDGVYDPCLGPLDKGDSCGTCTLGYFSCPGHFGYISLSAPTYNPLTFTLLYKLLQSTCFYCHRLRSSRIVIRHYEAKVQLVYAGLIVEAAELDNVIAVRGVGPRKTKKEKKREREVVEAARKKDKERKKGGSKKGGEEDKMVVDDEAEEGDEDEDEEEDFEGEDEDEASAPSSKKDEESSYRTPDQIIAEIDAYVERCLATLPTTPKPIKATIVTDTLAKIQRQFLSSIPNMTCANCRGQSPKFRKEGMWKIFQKGLTAKQVSSMQAKGLRMENAGRALRGIQLRGGRERDEDDMEVDFHEQQDEEIRAEELGDIDASVAEGTVAKKGVVAETSDKFLTPAHVQDHISLLWHRERTLLDLLFGSMDMAISVGGGQAAGRGYSKVPKRVSSPGMFFIKAVPVTPTRFRPISKMGDMTYDHPQNSHLMEILKWNRGLQQFVAERNALLSTKPSEGGVEATSWREQEKRLQQRIIDAWIRLTQNVNYLIDSSKAPLQASGKAAPLGIRQLLEKKEGLFRKHMMGKRVNYAARSVISPDPYIETSEIGIPPVFAVKLTYPEPVTVHNVGVLRRAVINGPAKWPGATHVQNEDGGLVDLARFDEGARTGIANQLLTPGEGGTMGVGKKVYRHLRNGDFLLLNRQPTLHKPSIMAHTARILPNEKTIRMHYANCNTYNADFDGDEMNAHFPQSELGRAEAMVIARTEKQYLVPTDGGVLRGLIQDHVDAGVDMCLRGTFFTREEYMQLVYGCLRPEGWRATGGNGNVGNGNVEERVEIGVAGRVVWFEPCLVKPVRRWSGKQVISTVLKNLTAHKGWSLNLKSKAKIGEKYFGVATEEAKVQFLEGELVTGVLDKSQFGASAGGLVHAVYEVFGERYAGTLLSVLGRLFTGYLQMVGFTCRMDDLRLTPEGDKKRRALVEESRGAGRGVAR
ncbi:hypothetical protein HK097_000328, partial [Rhizophlyctis rosea]